MLKCDDKILPTNIDQSLEIKVNFSVHGKVTFCVVKLDDVTTRNFFVAAAKKRSSQKIFGLASFVVDFILFFRFCILFGHVLLSHPRNKASSLLVP